jgi:hypothetical protein
MTHLTDKQEALLGAVGITGMATHRAGEATIVDVYLDGHRAIREGFISDHALQLGKGPFGVGSIRTPLLLTRLLAALAARSFANVGQVFQPDQAVGVVPRDACGNDMIGVKRAFSYYVVFARVQRVLLQRGEYSLAQPIQLALS